MVVRASLTNLVTNGETPDNTVEGEVAFSIFETSQIEFNVDLPSGDSLPRGRVRAAGDDHRAASAATR